MKRGLIALFIAIVLLTNINAQKDQLRVKINTDTLSNEGVSLNLTEFLGKQSTYYLGNNPRYVNVDINNINGMVKITPIGKYGDEVIIFTINKNFFIDEKLLNKEDFQSLLKESTNFNFDKSVKKDLVQPVEYINFERYKIRSTDVSLSHNILGIDIDDVSNIDLKLEKSGDNLVLKNINFSFTNSKANDRHLFYTKDTNLSLKSVLFSSFSIISSLLIIFLLIRKDKLELKKEMIKKLSINNLKLLKRRSYTEDSDYIFNEFFNEFRFSIAKILGLKYRFTINDLKNILDSISMKNKFRNEIIDFMKDILEINERKNISKKRLGNLVDESIRIIQKI